MSALADALQAADELEIVTRGRRTGRPHRVRVWFALDAGEDIWLRTDRGADWYQNLLHDGRCEIVVGDRALPADLVRTPDEAVALRELIELWRVKYGAEWVADWYVERGRVPVRLRVRDDAKSRDDTTVT